ncbi:unnamed protein product [Gadus morhua 'NCC']
MVPPEEQTKPKQRSEVSSFIKFKLRLVLVAAALQSLASSQGDAWPDITSLQSSSFLTIAEPSTCDQGGSSTSPSSPGPPLTQGHRGSSRALSLLSRALVVELCENVAAAARDMGTGVPPDVGTTCALADMRPQPLRPGECVTAEMRTGPPRDVGLSALDLSDGGPKREGQWPPQTFGPGSPDVGPATQTWGSGGPSFEDWGAQERLGPTVLKSEANGPCFSGDLIPTSRPPGSHLLGPQSSQLGPPLPMSWVAGLGGMWPSCLGACGPHVWGPLVPMSRAAA